jgi:hypothetical protein
MLWEYLVGQAVIVTVAVLGYLGTRSKLREVHTAVNGNLDEQLKRVEQLADALRAAGVLVPDRPDAGPSP